MISVWASKAMSSLIRKSPRLAIIGCGSVFAPARISSLMRIGWPPSVLVDDSLPRLDATAHKIGRAQILKSLDWLSVADAFDAAIVALPHALHGSIGSALLEAGKHVFFEPPLATTGADARATLAAANRKGLVLSVGFYRRHLQVARWVKALVLSGTLGQVTHFNVREGTVFSSANAAEVLTQPNVAAGGALTDVGVHTLDLLLWWLGDIASVSYRDDSQEGFEADCILDCALTSGATGKLQLSRMRPLRNSIHIEGTRGFVEVHLHKNEVLAGSADALAFRHDGIVPSAMKPQFLAELFDAELKDFQAAVSTGDGIDVSGVDDVKSILLIEHCYATRQALIQPWADVIAAAQSNGEVAHPALPKASKILVTGATGFIGCRLVERLVEDEGAEVRCTIRDLGRAARVARLPVELVVADLGNAADIDRAVVGVDYVFHCAYDTRTRSQNIDGLHNIIQACATHSVRRLIYVSSCAVYEPFLDGSLNEESPDGDRSNVYVYTKP